MRVAHVTATFPPHYAGTGVVCYYNALGLARLGHQVTVFTADYPPGDPVYPQEISVCRLPVPFRFGNAPFLPGLLRLDGFDLVHLHYPFYFGGEMVFLRSVLSGWQYVATYHQDVLFVGPLRFVERLHHEILGRRILMGARKILATSWDYARHSRLGELLQARAVAVGEMPNGVDAQRFHPHVDDRGLPAKYGLQHSDRIMLFVGALDKAHYFKGVGVLLQALAQLPDKGMQLLVVGEGELRSAYQRQAVTLGLGERVVFCGHVSDEELPAHYACCDLLVLPSTTMGEAFGLVLLEAMACGKPVIASNLPGVRSVVRNGDDGLLTQPGDAADLAAKIWMLMEDPQRRREMGERGRTKVEAKYDWPRIIPRLAQVYEEVLGGEYVTA